MQLNSKNVLPEIGVRHESGRPIHLSLGTLIFAMTAAEAIDLATQLADAVEELKTAEERNAP